METAGRAAYQTLIKTYGLPKNQTVTILVGKGNNGGDGLVMARLLYAGGAAVQVVPFSDANSMPKDASRNFKLLQQLLSHDRDNRLEILPFASVDQLPHKNTDLFVDALLGTGLTQDLRSPVREVVSWLNTKQQPVIALDVPTGLNSDTGAVQGAAVRADLTVTMAAQKTGLLLNEGPSYAGRVETAEIGIPSFILEEEAQRPGCAQVVSNREIANWLPQRSYRSHKYSVGMVVALAGSSGLTGAPVMASTAAARIGAGAVVCGCPRSVEPILSQKMTEVMTLGLSETPTGGLVPEALKDDLLLERLDKAQALLVGCGLGKAPSTQAFVRQLLQTTNLPLVLDADGLNALIGHTDLLTQYGNGRIILTPHAGEFQRLTGSEATLTDRVRTATKYAQRWNSVLLLKGFPSLVATPNGQTYINTTGGPALASAGTGDILAGLCAGLLAQGLSAEQTAVAGLHIGGVAADTFVENNASRALLATDLLALLPPTLHRYFS